MKRDGTEERLAALERASRVQRGVILTLAAALLAVVTMGASGVSEIVQARRIEVLDEGGRPLVSLEARDGRGVLELRSEERQLAVMLSTGPDGGALALYDERGHEVVGIGAARDGGLVEGSDASGRTLWRLASGAAGGGALATYGAGGAALVELGSTGDGDGSVTTHDAKGSPLVALTASERGGGRVVAYDGGKPDATWPGS